jgi:hypothetical protein
MLDIALDAAGLDHDPLSDDELTALALAADPDQEVAADAVPLQLYPERPVVALPLWYMPPAMACGSRAWRTPVVVAVIAALLLIDVFGLCITFGQLVAA